MGESKKAHSKISIDLEELRRLKAVKKEAKKLQNAKLQVQQVQPKVFERVFEALPDQLELETTTGSLRIMSFNMLAQSLIKRELFPDSGDMLKWKPRRKMILDEIQLYNPDILAMQELDNFEQYYQEIFRGLGYEVLHYHHPTKKHGCGIAYRHDKFTVKDYQTIDYNTDDTCAPSYMTGNIGQILALQCKTNRNIGFVVGNTHLYWRPSANYERFRQISIYEKRFLELKARMTSNLDTRWISLLLGDFNTEPIDPGYPILTNSSKKLKESEIRFLNESRAVVGQNDSGGEDEDDGEAAEIATETLATVDQLITLHANSPTWTSIYSNFGKVNKDENLSGHFGEPRFTDYASQFQGTLDYMFYRKDESVVIERILMLPSEEFVKPSLPNKNFGSDHLCLVADIKF